MPSTCKVYHDCFVLQNIPPIECDVKRTYYGRKCREWVCEEVYETTTLPPHVTSPGLSLGSKAGIGVGLLATAVLAALGGSVSVSINIRIRFLTDSNGVDEHIPGLTM